MGSISNIDDYTLVKILLFGGQNYSQDENAYIINATIKYLVDSERFNSQHLQLWFKCLKCIYDFFLSKNKVVTLSAYGKLLGTGLFISQVLPMYFSFFFCFSYSERFLYH